MVRTYADSATLSIPYQILCPVYFLRYPNPLASHVISVDVLSREVVRRKRDGAPSVDARRQLPSQVDEEEDAGTNVLRTTRLILKRGTLPKWAPQGIIRNAESWVLEETEVELDSHSQEGGSSQHTGRQMRCWTRNLDHTTVMAVTERSTFSEGIKEAGNGNGGPSSTDTRLDSHYEVESGMRFSLLRNRIEKFGIHRVATHAETSHQGLLTTYSRFINERLRGGTVPLLPGHFSDELAVALQQQQHQSRKSKKARLLEALRPPFLDGDFVGPLARFRQRTVEVRAWWKGLVRGGSADKAHMRLQRRDELDETSSEHHLTPTERLRKRFLSLRSGQASKTEPSQTSGAPGQSMESK